jgi:magnesium transporter
VTDDTKNPDNDSRGVQDAPAESPVAPPQEVVDENELVFGLSDFYIQAVVNALREGDRERVLSELAGLNAADTAELISKIAAEDRQILLRDFSEKLDPYVFSELSWELRQVILPELPAWQVAAIVSELDSDDALDIIQSLDDESFRHDIIRHLSAKTRLTLQEGLSFPEDSAGRLMQREFVAVPQFWTVGKTIDYLRAAAEELPDEFYDIFVIDPTHHVKGEIPLNRLVRAKRSEKLESLTLEESHPIPALMDQEEVAQMFRRENLMSAPVVDEEGRLIGVITVDDVVDVIDEEAQEDLLKLGGVGDIDTYKAVFSTSLSRSRWLFINMFTAFLAAGVVSIFGATIEKLVALAALMPVVAGMGGNAGTQSLAISVRAIAMREVSSANYKRLIFKESMVGLTNGALLSVVIGTLVALLFGNIMLGLVIAMALIVNLFVAGLFGSGVPLLLHKFGQDPAISSAIFVTTMTDVLGFFAFLGLATLLLL